MVQKSSDDKYKKEGNSWMYIYCKSKYEEYNSADSKLNFCIRIY